MLDCEQVDGRSACRTTVQLTLRLFTAATKRKRITIFMRVSFPWSDAKYARAKEKLFDHIEVFMTLAGMKGHLVVLGG